MSERGSANLNNKTKEMGVIFFVKETKRGGGWYEGDVVKDQTFYFFSALPKSGRTVILQSAHSALAKEQGFSICSL